MKAFNPERELRKIQHGNKNKIIIGVVALLIILEISSSYALYQVRYSKRIIYTKVAPFSNNDIDLAVLVDGKSEDDFPEKDAGKIYDKIDCGKTNVKAYWDYDKWALVLETSKKAKCTVYFKTGTSGSGEKLDTSGANPPELYQGLIPIKYEDKDEDGTPEIVIADKNSTDWYNYDEKRWANAVLIDNKDTTRVKDLSGNGNYATIVGGAEITNEGLVLDGNDDGIYLGDMLKDLFNHSNTFQIKFKRTETGNSSMLLGNYPVSKWVLYIVNENNNYWLVWYDKANSSKSGNFNSNNVFTTLTFVYDRDKGTINVYNDSELVLTNSNNLYKTDTINYTDVYIGRDGRTDSNPLQGVIEKVMIYDKALTLEEIQQNLSASSGKIGDGGIVEDSLHIYYDFKVPQTVDTTPGKVLNMNAISQMYVWIPRYKYALFNATSGYVSNEQMINIKFEHNTETTGTVSCEINDKGKETCNNVANGNWYTHPAFTFGDTELPGIWVGKFESSGNLTDIKILPDMDPIRSQSISTFFEASRNIGSANVDTNTNKYNLEQKQINTRMPKNTDWGAIVYLTHSKYGICNADGSCNEMPTNAKLYTTGYDNANNLWNTSNGEKASTTGNMYGIYDIKGCSWEFTMGIMLDIDGNVTIPDAGFSEIPDEKYYDKYEYGTNYLDHKRGHLGDATRETLKTFGVERGSWYSDLMDFPCNTGPFFIRGGRHTNLSLPGGLFTTYYQTGQSNKEASFRVILTAQDGNE